jgi:outer membrane protein
MRIKRALLVTIGCILMIQSSAQQKDTTSSVLLTLPDAVEQTLENNFQIRISKNNVRIADNNNTPGNAGMLPEVTATGGFTRNSQNTDLEFANGETQTRDGASRQLVNAGINMSWTLFDGTRMFATLDRLEQEALVSNLQLKLQIDNVLSQMLQSFYRVALEQERLNLFEENVDFSEERVRIVDEKYKVGKESKLSLLQAKVDLNTDRSSLVQQKELLTAQKLNLLQLMGVEPFEFKLEYEVSINDALTLSELEEASASNNPSILVQQRNEEIQNLQIKELNRSRLPQLDLNLGYGYSNLESEAGFLFRNQTLDFNYGVSARVNLFSGLNQIRNLQNAQIQLENTQLLQAEAEQLIQSQVLSSYTTYINNLELLALESENLDVANENSEIALERFRLGVSDALALREAQVNAVNAQIRFLQSQFNAKAAEIELYRLSGRLTETVN